MFACEDIKIRTYYRKMSVLSIGIARRMAVTILLKKKIPGTASLVLDYLSSFKSNVLNDDLASLILSTSNLRHTTVIKNAGIMMDITKMT